MTIRIDKNSGELFLYGVVGEMWDGEGFGTSEVLDALAALGGKRAIVRINSPGGYASDGVAIYNALKRYSGGVDTIVDSIAASAASIIALAGEKRITARGGRWMIHRAMCLAMGNVTDMQHAIDALSNCDQSLIDIYQTCMPGTPEEIRGLMEAETWYTGETAMAAGLSTAIGDQTNAKPKIAAWFKNTPQALLSQVHNRGVRDAAKAKLAKIMTR